MAGTFRAYFGWVHSLAGRAFDFLDPRACQNEVASTGTRGGAEEEVTVDAGDTVEVYNYLRDGDFEAFALQIIGDGYLYVYFIVDKPTSATDLTPSGLAQRSIGGLQIANHAPFVLNTDQVQAEPTATVSKTYSLTGYSTATGTGTPDLIASATDVTGKIYSILLYNPDADDSVSVIKGHAN